MSFLGLLKSLVAGQQSQHQPVFSVFQIVRIALERKSKESSLDDNRVFRIDMPSEKWLIPCARLLQCIIVEARSAESTPNKTRPEPTCAYEENEGRIKATITFNCFVDDSNALLRAMKSIIDQMLPPPDKLEEHDYPTGGKILLVARFKDRDIAQYFSQLFNAIGSPLFTDSSKAQYFSVINTFSKGGDNKAPTLVAWPDSYKSYYTNHILPYVTNQRSGGRT